MALADTGVAAEAKWEAELVVGTAGVAQSPLVGPGALVTVAERARQEAARGTVGSARVRAVVRVVAGRVGGTRVAPLGAA